MNAITEAATAAKVTIDRLLSNGKNSATSGLIKGEQWDAWAYIEQFSGPEISVNYRRDGNKWAYTAESNSDSTLFFSKSGLAKTLREARLEALDAVVAGCAAQVENAKNGAKEELIRIMRLEVPCHIAIMATLESGLLPVEILFRYLLQLTKQSISSAIGSSGCHSWEDWAGKWLSGDDRSELAALAAAKIAQMTSGISTAEAAAYTAVEFARGTDRARDLVFWAAGAETATGEAQYKRQQQHRDLLALINEM